MKQKQGPPRSLENEEAQYIGVQDSLVRLSIYILLPGFFLFAVIIWLLDFYPIFVILSITLIMMLVALVLCLKDRSHQGKIILCIGSPPIVAASLILYPDIKSAAAYAFVIMTYPCFLFSFKHSKNLILTLMIYSLIVQSIGAIYNLSPFRFSFSDKFGPEIWLLDAAVYFVSLTNLSLYILAFTYRIMKVTDTVQAQKRNISQILGNIDEGLFTVNQHGTINPEYSKWLESFFKQQKIEGLTLEDLCYKNSTLESSHRGAIDFVVSTVGESSLMFEANSKYLPLQFGVQVDNRPKEIELNWAPIVENDVLQKILFTIKDITEQATLKNALARQNDELELLNSLLITGIERSLAFFQDAKKMLSEALRSENYQEIMVNLHTLKGNALTIGLPSVATQAHNLEEFLRSQLKQQTPKNWELSRERMAVLSNIIHQYLYIIDKYLGAILKTTATQESHPIFLRECLQAEIDGLPMLCQKYGLNPVSIDIKEEKL